MDKHPLAELEWMDGQLESMDWDEIREAFGDCSHINNRRFVMAVRSQDHAEIGECVMDIVESYLKGNLASAS